MGIFRSNGRLILAHRLSYELFVAEIPDDSCVCHVCDNRRCIKPDHPFVASHRQNMEDAARKGKFPKKLTASDVIEIQSDIRRHQQVANFYGVDRSTIKNIKLEKKRTHVPVSLSAGAEIEKGHVIVRSHALSVTRLYAASFNTSPVCFSRATLASG
jgi:hypothetical protein